MSDRFPDRYAGTSYGPFIVDVFESDGTTPKDLTGDTATYTFRKAVGGVAVIDAAAHTNTPGVGGQFEYQAETSDMQAVGEYTVTVVMIIGGETEVSRYGLTILPAF